MERRESTDKAKRSLAVLKSELKMQFVHLARECRQGRRQGRESNQIYAKDISLRFSRTVKGNNA